MKFRTELNLCPTNVKICHTDSIFMIGSCFTSTIGKKLQKSKFHAMVNPYGTLFHPFIIKENIENALSSKSPAQSFLTQVDNRSVHYKYHSDLHANNGAHLIKSIEKKNQQVRSFLKKSNFTFITLGTSFYFYHKKLGQVVGNCHKQPSSLFSRKLASASEIIKSLNQLVFLIKTHNPTTDIIFTVSPVRHIRDGLVENSRSKAHLLTAVHEVADQNEQVHYFPAYEMVMDDLRDYRFYDEDLLHPNGQAISYIWSKFSGIYFSTSTNQLVTRIEKILKSIAHKPFERSSSSYRNFLIQLKDDMTQISEETQLDFSQEIEEISEQLST